MTPLLAQGLRSDRSFERLYRRHAADVYRYALAVLRNPADAEDVTQTTFLNAYRAFQKGERPRQPQNWLIAIAHNVCRQRFRHATRRPQEVALDGNTTDRLEQDERGPTADDLRRALGHLAFNQRAALVMRELEGRSYAEIAELLGVSVPAVETLIFRARRAVREQLEGSLTCEQAERALSLEVDGRLSRSDKGPLRAHLRECKPCAKIARSQRAQRSAFKALAALPLPSSLGSLLGGGGATLATKAAAVAVGAALVGGVGLAGEQRLAPHTGKATSKPVVVSAPAARRPAHLTAPVVYRAAPVRRAAHPVNRRHAKPGEHARLALHVKKGRGSGLPVREAGPAKSRRNVPETHNHVTKQQVKEVPGQPAKPARKQQDKQAPGRHGHVPHAAGQAGGDVARPVPPGQAKTQAPEVRPQPSELPHPPVPAAAETTQLPPGQLRHAN